MSFAFSTITINSLSEVESVLAPLLGLHVRTLTADTAIVLYTNNNHCGIQVESSGYTTVFVNDSYQPNYYVVNGFPWTVRYWKDGVKFVAYVDNGKPTYISLSTAQINGSEVWDVLMYMCADSDRMGKCAITILTTPSSYWWTDSGARSASDNKFYFNSLSGYDVTNPTMITQWRMAWNNNRLFVADDIYVPLAWQENTTITSQEVMTLNNKEYYKFPNYKGIILLDVS